MIKTARSWGVPPSQIIQGKPCEWSRVDSLLSTALVLVEEETCRECGTVSWLGHSTNNYIGFEVDQAVCYGCAAMENHRKEEGKNKKPTPGAKPYVSAFMYGEGTPLPSRDEEYERRRKKG